jgi:hypothetical protein
MTDISPNELERQRNIAWKQHWQQMAMERGDEIFVPPHKGAAAWNNTKPKAPVTPTPSPTTPLHRRLNAEERAAYLATRHDRPEEAVGVQVYWPNCWHEKNGTIIATPGNGNVKVRFSDGRVMTVRTDFLTTPPAESVAV